MAELVHWKDEHPMRRAWDLALLPFALAWMVVLLALVMLRVVHPDSLARNIRQAHWPPAEPLPESSAGGDSRLPPMPAPVAGTRVN